MKLIDFLNQYEISSSDLKRNFFQIAGFPHYENVFSNVFAFLLENEYLIYHSLLDCLNLTPNDEVEEVIREDRTDENKRIDIIVKTTDMILGIENKIEASLYNDTDNYYKHLKNISDRENKKLVCIILSKKKILEVPSDFKNILHIDLANSIKKYFNELSNKMDARYFQLLNEFIENIMYLQKETAMDAKFVKLLENKEFRAKIENIIENSNLVRKELENKAKELLLGLNINKIFEKKWIYKDVSDTGYFSITAVIENFLPVKNYKISIDIYIEYNSYSFKIFDRKEKHDPIFYKTIKDILPDYDENYEDIDDGVNYKHDIYEYDVMLDKINELINYFKNYKKQKHGT
jgi:hypothetical protein